MNSHIPSHGHNPHYIPARTVPQHEPTHNHIPQYEPTQSHVSQHMPANNRVLQQVSSYNPVYTKNTQNPQGSTNETIDRSIQSMHSQQIQPDIKINSTHGETQQSSSTSISNCQKNSEVVKTIHTEQLQYETENIPTNNDCQVYQSKTLNHQMLIHNQMKKQQKNGLLVKIKLQTIFFDNWA
jgi:hypothetical protein